MVRDSLGTPDLDQWLSTFFGPWTIFKNVSYGPICYADIS